MTYVIGILVGLFFLFVIFQDKITLLRAKLGNADSQFTVGRNFYQGKGNNRDVKEALKYFVLAAENGHSIAPGMVAMIYKMGDGVPKDLIKAYAWLLHSSLVAPTDLLKGTTEQIESIEKSLTPDELKKGDIDGENINKRVSSKTNNSFKGNGTKGYLSLHKAAQMGVGEAQFVLGEKFYQGHKYKEAKAWFEKAIQKNNADAIFRLGEIFYFGKGETMDSKKASELYKQAAELGHKGAIQALKSFEK